MKCNNRDKYTCEYNLGQREGGIFFSVVTLSMVLASMVASLIVGLLAGGNGASGEAFDKITGSDAYKIISYCVNSVVLFIVMMIFSRLYSIKPTRLCLIKKAESNRFYIFALLIFIGSFFGLSYLNEYFINFLTQKFGYTYSQIELPSLTPINYILVILTVCVLPAIAEEFAFRGVLCSSFSQTNPIIASICVGICFSLFHMNPAQTPYQFCVGFVYALLALKSGSVFLTVAIHFLNNFIIVTFNYFWTQAFNLEPWINVMITILGLICLVLAIILLIKEKTPKKKCGVRTFFNFSWIGLAVCVLFWIMGVMT